MRKCYPFIIEKALHVLAHNLKSVNIFFIGSLLVKCLINVHFPIFLNL